jgi:4-hydroxy-tetrahydrodipicolinate reductase
MRNKIRICIAGATGWAGSLIAKTILESEEFSLVGAIARKKSGEDIGVAIGMKNAGVRICSSLEELKTQSFDVLIDYTKPDSVKQRTLIAIGMGIRVVIGTSGLSASDYDDIERAARSSGVGVIAGGNFSVTAALAKHFALMAANYLPSWEIIDYAHADKVDAPSGTTRELAESLSEVKRSKTEHPIASTIGHKEARGATISGTQVHSVRLPSYVIAFETIFGLPDERLTIRHDAGTGAGPYVAGTLMAAKAVMEVTGLVRGLDTLLFGKINSTSKKA